MDLRFNDPGNWDSGPGRRIRASYCSAGLDNFRDDIVGTIYRFVTKIDLGFANSTSLEARVDSRFTIFGGDFETDQLSKAIG